MLLVFLPKEKVMAEGTAYTPPETPSLRSSRRKFRTRRLYDNLKRLKLDVQTIAPFHGARRST